MSDPRRPGTAGFTLVEAVIAVTLSAVIVVLVSSVFLAQNRFYDDMLRRSGVHDHARSVVELVAGEVRPVTEGGVVLADSLRLVLREPLSVGVVCRVQGSRVSLYLPRAGAGLDTAHVTGYGVRGSEGTWRFYDGSWGSLYDGSGQSVANDCAQVGFETSDVPVSHFVRLRGPGSVPNPRPSPGGGFLLHRELELRFATSDLDPAHRALFRGTSGTTLVEFATGLGADTHFRYRLRGEDDFEPTVSGGDLDRIDAVRILAHAVDGDQGEELDRYDYRLVRDVPIRNGSEP